MYYFTRDSQSLPDGFKLPELFLTHAVGGASSDLYPWFFLAEEPVLATGWSKIVADLYPSRRLLPFAKRDDNDDVACFDLTDTSGDPRVYLVHAYASPGWEDQGMLANFQAWLGFAADESKDFQGQGGSGA